MAILGPFTDASVTVNSVDLSDHVRSVTINYGAEVIETTAMGSTTKTRVAGVKDWTVDVEFIQDFSASKVDATLFPLVGAAPFTIAIKPTSGAVSATNPNYNGSCILTGYPILDGAHGALATTKVRFEAASILTRATT